MLTSVLPAIKKVLIITTVALTLAVNYCFKYKFDEQDWLVWANKCLAQSYDTSADAKLKKWELLITPDSFIRLRKTYAKGKQEYYSFNLHKLNNVDYVGNPVAGILELKTIADDIIVQTRNDRKGDVDSMTTALNIPLKNIPTERLDSLEEALNYFKEKGL
ncbi:hypothetical protein JN11_01406 [Mucilaginibacter frigoritolerans]|jgi:hypothetical protein|uniref:Uncharacterized protein n=1 Tax=Mucilaginibacter frigoritolerans TaxID=652788 RepID=A0A562U9C0_9SPHI|nr:hypothetical protein [Mucilaginibacter frigoritolerans]TWJ02433.1 hypothetical protein JN11_01406 [Mucilaginibacter frigoritolerans]